MRIIFFFSLLLYSILTNAQQVIQGVVVDADAGTPLSDVQITVRKEKLILQYTSSDKKGGFKIKTPADSKGKLFFSFLGYKTVEIELSEATNKTKIEMTAQSFSINEVTVKAPKIRGQGDTIMYFVEQFSSERDKTIGDVLKKMPGIDIDTEGKITYNGKSINKFYIEGQDLLGGRYGLAVNGIPQKEVGQIEVYEDHQPIRALEGLSFSDQAAINVKLKENAKAHWITTLDMGSGLPLPLWEAKLFAMCIRGDKQNISILKSNNNGHDLSRECQTVATRGLSEEEESYNQGQYIDVKLPEVPYLSKEHTLDNRSHLFSTNQLWNLKNDYQLKGQINYLNDEIKAGTASTTTYYLPEEDFTLTEIEDGKADRNMLATTLTIIGNKKSFYLNNSLNTEWRWNDTDLITQNSEDRIREKASLPSYKISNSFSLVKRIKQHSLSLTSFALWQSDPHDLGIRTNGQEQANQAVTSNLLFNNNSASYSFALKKLVVSATGGAGFFLHKIENSRTVNIPSEDLFVANSTRTNYIHTYLTPKIELNKKILIATLQCSINYYHYLYKANTTRRGMDYFYCSPSLRVQYNITPDLKWTVFGSLSDKKPNVFQWYDGMIIQNYRNLRLGQLTEKKSSSKIVSTTVAYKNLPLLLFANANVLLQWDGEEYIENRNFQDNGTIIYSSIPKSYQSSQQIMSAKVSKGIHWIDGAASLQGTYYAQHSRMNQNETLTPYSTNMYILSGSINGKIGQIMDWNYNISYSKSTLKTEDEQLLAYRGLSNKLSTDWHLSKKITLRADAEHYKNEISEKKFKSIFFLDASLVYKVNRKLEMSLNADNLLNKDRYDYTITGNLSMHTSKQNIRGRNIFIRFYYLL